MLVLYIHIVALNAFMSMRKIRCFASALGRKVFMALGLFYGGYQITFERLVMSGIVIRERDDKRRICLMYGIDVNY